jgi:predicted RNA-binding protein with PUA-like domain
MQHWLMKSEPGNYSIDDLKVDRVTWWDGVRNYQVRNMMRDDFRKGDLAFFYHSECKEPGIVGIMTITSGAYPDPTAFDPKEKYFDPKSDPENPRWLMVDVRYKRRLKRPISLKELRDHGELAEMPLLRRGNRLSITPVTPDQWAFIMSLE